MTVSRRKICTAMLGGLFVPAALESMAEGRAPLRVVVSPHVLVTPEGRDALREKITRFAWAKTAYEKNKAEVDHFATLCEKQPDYLTSRLLLNWNTHYTRNFVQKDKWVRGDGFAPVPTPRFAGARDWATPWSLPPKIEDFRPFNDASDKSGMIWLLNKDTKKEEWTHPAPTGRTIEVGNARLMKLAADAAFVFFMEGNAKYARMASQVLVSYLDGFRYVSLPVDLGGKNQIIGTSSFEVIHESILPFIGLAYDFLRPYFIEQKGDTGMLEAQMKRMCDRVIDGGGAEGNWNLNQINNFIYPGLALLDNAAYADKRGRQYYADVVLSARLPAQKGILHVIDEGYDHKTALWPEAPGYGFGTTPQMLRFAMLLQNDPGGARLLQDPFLTRAVLTQQELLFPDGYSTGLGDTTNTRIRSDALELGIASARARGDGETELRLSLALQKEITGGFYDRSKETDIFSLTHFVGDLRTATESLTASSGSRTYFGEPLNIVFQRNLSASGDVDHSLAAALYGTKGGHVHSNGMAMELFGSGLILGADPGRGASYWTADHHEYYMQPPAHNTVVVNGACTYGENAKPQHEMGIALMEPESQKTALSPHISVVTGTFHYEQPVRADQRRTLALIRTGEKTGFYFDVFRSRTQNEADGFHDYFYHNMGQNLMVSDRENKPFALTPSQALANQNGLMKAYQHFKNERSATVEDKNGFHAVFTAKSGERETVMALWMLGSPNRHLFALDAPKNNAGRHLPAPLRDAPMPTVLVRQTGDAWAANPFVAVYEPYIGAAGPVIKAVRPLLPGTAGFATCMVEGAGFRVCLMDSDENAQSVEHEAEGGLHFRGSFGVVQYRSEAVYELYLVRGIKLEAGEVGVGSTGNNPVSVSLRRDGSDWVVSTLEAVQVRVLFALPAGATDGSGYVLACQTAPGQKPTPVRNSRCRITAGTDGQKAIVAEGMVPAGQDVLLRLIGAA